ncbi:MAG: hypothetical protein ABIX01_16765 [Chitinophagaceae bacterium]
MAETAIPQDKYFDDGLLQPLPVRILAQALSYLFHPMFIPALVTGVLLWLHPINNLLLSDMQKPRMFAMVLIYTGMFPAVAVFLLWRLKFIGSIFLRTQKERIIPFVIAMFFFFWIYYVSRNLDSFPISLKQFLMGVFLSSASALFSNIYTKISMHALAMGGMVGFSFVQQFSDNHWQSNWSLAALLLAGAVCSARLILKAHRPVDVYAGFFVGVLCQVAAHFMIGS